MAATQADIANWFAEGKEKNATHMIVVCDTYDHADYPVYVGAGDDVRQKATQYGQNMQRVMEVYSLNLDLEEQLSEYRAFHYD